ncbi:Helicase conserved C-terminal domain-containing protein [Halorubrum ezzemoulense]|uniref:Helicase conserved C-terminal domain-containing protein n=2 Tax=Halorubrum ezzemoulense TaxID=337243 RepID=A0A238Y240_HALEZ|nr:Helicase conserved C-terminal domain-containing protein [Halorubrum ezzemoulense]
MLKNSQIRYAGQEDPSAVTDAIKYERKQQDRRQTSLYTGDDGFVDSILEFFEFDPLDFQVNSWQTVNRLNEERWVDNETKGGVFSAPTGFGKTEAFLGPIYQHLRDGQQDSVAIVYPSRALLQDQLGRILKHIHDIKTDHGDQLSVGCYVGDMPWKRSEFGTKSFFDSGGGRKRFTLCDCWCGEDTSHSFELRGTSQSYVLECEHDSTHRFTDRELVLPRSDLVFNDQPDIVLTTIESLENFSHKPHYPLIERFDTIVLDEVHLYTGLRGAHAAKIIQNVNHISEDPLLWLGSSATIDDPQRFGSQIFGLDSSDVETTKPPSSDFDDSSDDYEHYYFMLAPEDGPGVSSMAIQQSMLLGHTMLEDPAGSRSLQLSFIDSISQINQQRVQFEDADQNDRLWEFHRDDEFDEDWDAVASAMDQRFIDEPLGVMPVYSEQGFDREEASQNDIILSTNFLEVGIDVGEIKIITQHRTPWNLSSFLQRAGRAARKPGMDSHIAVYLSSLTGDANMFYRADRFLGSDIRTPLNTNNSVVEWIHSRFQRYYDVVEALDQEHFRSDLEKHATFLENYLDTNLGYNGFYQLLVDPQQFFQTELEIDVSADRLLSKRLVESVRQQLDEYLADQHEELSDIEAYFDMEDGEIIRGEDAIETYVIEVQETTLKVINTFDGQVSGFENELESQGATGYEPLVRQLRDDISDATSRVKDIPEGSTDAVVHFSTLLADLFGMVGQLMQLRNQANQAASEPLAQVRDDRLSELNDAVNQLETLSQDDRLQEYYRLEKQVHYLKSALDEYESYLDARTPYNSLYRIKDLLRSAYYFDLYLQSTDRHLDEEMWFVPPDYFGSSGQFVKVLKEGQTSERPEESIDQILNTYAPYKSEYQATEGLMNAFLPKTKVTEDGVEMDYTRHVTGEEQDGVLVPETLQLSEMRDESDKAMQMVRYCPECYQVLSGGIDRCLRHNGHDPEYGKIHSEPHVATTVTDRTPVERRGGLTLADMEAKVALESVTLEITPGKYYGSDIGIGYDPERERFTETLESPDPPLGYTTRTRGLIYDLEPFMESLDESVREYVERYKDVDDDEFEQLVYHTAAHFFLQFVTDISSVSNQRVFYGFDQSIGEVYVFERTEGGQGIVDLVYEEIQTDPGSVLESMNRLMYNEQVIAERLWAHPDFVDDLPEEAVETDRVRPVIVDHIGPTFDDVIDRVTEEVVSQIDHATQFAADESIAVNDAYRIKHVVATAQVSGEDAFPADAVRDTGIDVSDMERVETAFQSPDIDGCVENLHITECIAAGDQSDTLSYVVLEALRDQLTETVHVDDAADTMFEHELPPGGETDATSVFLDF